MFKYIKTKVSGKMKLNKKVFVFSAFYILVFVCILALQSFLPISKIESCSNDISILSSKSETKTSLVYFKPRELENVESIQNIIETFNRKNDNNSQSLAYKNFVGTNFDKKAITIPSLEDKNPVILMSTRLSQYSLHNPNELFYYSGIKLLGLSHGKNKSSNFCYITTRQADYIINNSSGKYTKYEDLIDETLEFNISGFNGESKIPYYIQDIIVSNEGNDNRYNELFGSYIYCYYLTFQKNTGVSFAFDMGSNTNENSAILNEGLQKYPLDKYELSFANETDINLQNKIIKNLHDSDNNSNLTTLFAILEIVISLAYVFIVFSFILKDDSYSILLSIFILSLFFIFYNLLLLLSSLKIHFVSIFFNHFTNIIQFSFTFIVLCSIFIAAFFKTKPSKFPRNDR